jgi:hypothetical protein
LEGDEEEVESIGVFGRGFSDEDERLRGVGSPLKELSTSP